MSRRLINQTQALASRRPGIFSALKIAQPGRLGQGARAPCDSRMGPIFSALKIPDPPSFQPPSNPHEAPDRRGFGVLGMGISTIRERRHSMNPPHQ